MYNKLHVLYSIELLYIPRLLKNDSKFIVFIEHIEHVRNIFFWPIKVSLYTCKGTGKAVAGGGYMPTVKNNLVPKVF